MTRLKPVRGKAFPSSSDHGEAAEPRQARAGAGAAAATLFCRSGFAQTGPKVGLVSRREWDSTGSPQCWDPHPGLGSETWRAQGHSV